MALLQKPVAMILVIVAIFFTVNFGIEYANEIKNYQRMSIVLAERQKQIAQEKKSKHQNWPFTYADYECMAKNVYHEARGESTEGQLAVAIVTRNRWNNSRTDSICDVVYKRGQFSWTRATQLTTDYSSKQWAKAMWVTQRVLEFNYRMVGLENATFYHSVRVNPFWAKSKIYLKTIGQHRFYK